MFVEEAHIPRCFILYTVPVAREEIETPGVNDLEGCFNTFGNIVYVKHRNKIV